MFRLPSPTRLSSMVYLGAMFSILSFHPSTALAQASGIPPDQLPQFTGDGSLREPSDWETWVMVGASTGLSYNAPSAAPAAGAAPGTFHNVYIQPWAYREFMRTGVFPERTMLVLSFFEASRKSAPAKAGFYEGDRVPDIDIHVKQKGSNQTGWVFFGFSEGAAVGGKLPSSASCYSCHASEAAHDNVFTQFYPFMRVRLAALRH